MSQPLQTPPSAPVAEPGVMHCYRHPDRETLMRCQRCDRPICRPLQVLVLVCIVLGVLIARFIELLVTGWPAGALLSVQGIIALSASALLPSVVYIIFAIIGAIARLR